MKNFKMLKKFGAAVTAVAMVGSMSVVAFADGLTGNNIATANNDDISITGVDVEKDDNIYTIVVKYNTTATGDITMLSYVSGAFTEVVTPGADQEYNDGTMQIVGIDQTATQTDKKITFKVTKDETAPINVKDNPICVVKLGGTGISTPAAAMINLEAPWEVASGTLEDIEVTVDLDAENDAVLSAIKTALVGQVVSLAGEKPGYTAELTLTEDLVEGNVDALSETDASGNNYTLTIAAGTKLSNITPEDTKAAISEDLAVPFKVTVTREITSEWTADKAEVEPVTVQLENGAEATEENVLAAVQSALTGKSATVSLSTDSRYTGKVTLTEGMVTKVEKSTEDETVWIATVDIPSTADASNMAGIPEAGLTATVTVTVTAEADIQYGDVDLNGEIDITDVLLAFGLAFDDAQDSDEYGTIKEQAQRADVDINGEVDITDVLYIFQKAFEDDISFPIGAHD